MGKTAATRSAVGFVVAAFATACAAATHSESAHELASGGSARSSSSCVAADSANRLDLTVGPAVGRFSDACYTASSHDQLLIRFKNELRTQVSRSSVALQLTVFHEWDYNAMSHQAASPAGPSPIVGINMKSAVFTAPQPQPAGRMTTLNIGTLAPGRYVITALPYPTQLRATLTLS